MFKYLNKVVKENEYMSQQVCGALAPHILFFLFFFFYKYISYYKFLLQFSFLVRDCLNYFVCLKIFFCVLHRGGIEVKYTNIKCIQLLIFLHYGDVMPSFYMKLYNFFYFNFIIFIIIIKIIHLYIFSCFLIVVLLENCI